MSSPNFKLSYCRR
ncbi:BgTH12-01929 [Blumeria graminis f. sp. triticale]|uniref:BgTH12-01929 n=1 Tax=Blumeria graminis f. sp. triticale TaxID=1689686 RepID=A0A9W4D032_BLUGR|nr:BgTH12-01929 [Blumeria graminis f. sp. triticale]